MRDGELSARAMGTAAEVTGPHLVADSGRPPERHRASSSSAALSRLYRFRTLPLECSRVRSFRGMGFADGRSARQKMRPADPDQAKGDYLGERTGRLTISSTCALVPSVFSTMTRGDVA